jgi:hypothetical protein
LEWCALAEGLHDDDLNSTEPVDQDELYHDIPAANDSDPPERSQTDNSALRRKRPDGIAIHWGKRKFYLLEYTRCFDSKPNALADCDTRKVIRYSQLVCKMLEILPQGWTGETLAFSIGIRGSLQTEAWIRNLKCLGIKERSFSQTLDCSVSAALEALGIVFASRSSLLDQKHARSQSEG